MTTELLDESLDVRKRLEHLRAWQAEWSRIDHLLEEQVLQLDGNKPLEMQQANHIATLRRRMEMTLAKTPLSIEVSATWKVMTGSTPNVPSGSGYRCTHSHGPSNPSPATSSVWEKPTASARSASSTPLLALL